MGKKNSKLQNNTLEKLTAETYCKHAILVLRVYLPKYLRKYYILVSLCENFFNIAK